MDSMWGVAQFSLSNESPCTCAFVGDKKSVVGKCWPSTDIICPIIEYTHVSGGLYKVCERRVRGILGEGCVWCTRGGLEGCMERCRVGEVYV